MGRSLILGAAIAGVILPGVALAQADGPFAPIAGPWTVTVGIEGRVMPSFPGSDRAVLAPFPTFDLRKAGTPRRFSSPRDGIGVAVINEGQFRFGPAANFVLSRRESDDPALVGLGNVDWTLELGVFAEYWALPWMRTRVEVRQGVYGGHHGTVADFTADGVWAATPALTMSAGPRLSVASGEAMQPYFGVTPAQSITSGLPAFSAKSGVRSYGAGAQARYEWSQQWASKLFVEYDRLTSDAARSPIVSQIGSPNQTTIGFGLSYTFDIDLR
jgi:outer membrane protein